MIFLLFKVFNSVITLFLSIFILSLRLDLHDLFLIKAKHNSAGAKSGEYT